MDIEILGSFSVIRLIPYIAKYALLRTCLFAPIIPINTIADVHAKHYRITLFLEKIFKTFEFEEDVFVERCFYKKIFENNSQFDI